MSILAEAAAAAADRADRSQPRHLGIELGVKLPQLAVKWRPAANATMRSGLIVNHHFPTIASDAWISAIVWTRP